MGSASGRAGNGELETVFIGGRQYASGGGLNRLWRSWLGSRAQAVQSALNAHNGRNSGALKKRVQHNSVSGASAHSGMEAMQGVMGSACRRVSRWLLLPMALAVAVPAPADAEPGYPNRPVRILVPYGPGGVADTTVRLLAQKLNERLGQQFVIENRPGAGGILAAKAGASAAPDGYTLALTGNGTAISKSLFKSLPYDVLRDFKSVSVMAWLDLTIATKADGPLKTVSDIVAAAKKDPGKLNFGTIAPGSTQHLSAELFRLTGDIKVTMVTFRTTPDLVTALLRGDVDVGFDYLAGFRAQTERPAASGRGLDRRKAVAFDPGRAHGE